MKITHLVLAIVVGVVLCLLGMKLLSPGTALAGVTGGSQSDACASTTNAVMAVGKDIPTTLLSTTSNRAVARIQQPKNATNTIAISDTIAAASFLTAGIQLSSTTAAINTLPSISLGLNTEIPYTGAISAIADTGSTTLLVSTCNY